MVMMYCYKVFISWTPHLILLVAVSTSFLHFSRYNLKMWTYDGPIQEGLRLALIEHPEMKAVLMGTRRSDPSGKSLALFQVCVCVILNDIISSWSSNSIRVVNKASAVCCGPSPLWCLIDKHTRTLLKSQTLLILTNHASHTENININSVLVERRLLTLCCCSCNGILIHYLLNDTCACFEATQ